MSEAPGSICKGLSSTEEEVRRIVRATVSDMAPYRPPRLLDETRLIEDLEYHSLALFELAVTLEDEFELRQIDGDTAALILTVRDVEEHVVGELRDSGRL